MHTKGHTRLSTFVFKRTYRMAGPIFIIILTYLVTISTVNARAILDKNLNRISKFDFLL